MSDFAERQPNPPLPPTVDLGLIDDLPADLAAGLARREHTLGLYTTAASIIVEMMAPHVRDEEKRNAPQPKELCDIPADELLAFASLVRQTAPSGRYPLTTEYASNGKRWYDVLYGLHSPSLDVAIEVAIPAQPEPWHTRPERALDLATCLGKTARVLSRYAQHTIGIDSNPALLTAAHEDVAAVEFVCGSLDALPFPDGSMKLITCSGLLRSLSASESLAAYREIARVLASGGTYVEADYAEPREIFVQTPSGNVVRATYHPEYLKTFVTWKAVLQDLIVESITGWSEMPDEPGLGEDEWDQFLNELELDEDWLYAHPLQRNWFAHARLLHKR